MQLKERTAGSPKKQRFFRYPFLKSLFPFEETGFFVVQGSGDKPGFQINTRKRQTIRKDGTQSYRSKSPEPGYGGGAAGWIWHLKGYVSHGEVLGGAL